MRSRSAFSAPFPTPLRVTGTPRLVSSGLGAFPTESGPRGREPADLWPRSETTVVPIPAKAYPGLPEAGMARRQLASVVWHQRGYGIDLIYVEGESERIVGSVEVAALLAEDAGLDPVPTPDDTLRWAQRRRLS